MLLQLYVGGGRFSASESEARVSHRRLEVFAKQNIEHYSYREANIERCSEVFASGI